MAAAGENGDEMEGVVDDEEAQMQALMGFDGFGTTKQKKVRGNDTGGVYKNKPTKYRQYMCVSPTPFFVGVEPNANFGIGIGLEGLIERFRLLDTPLVVSLCRRVLISGFSSAITTGFSEP